eukprot:g6308.t1
MRVFLVNLGGDGEGHTLEDDEERLLRGCADGDYPSQDGAYDTRVPSLEAVVTFATDRDPDPFHTIPEKNAPLFDDEYFPRNSVFHLKLSLAYARNAPHWLFAIFAHRDEDEQQDDRIHETHQEEELPNNTLLAENGCYRVVEKGWAAFLDPSDIDMNAGGRSEDPFKMVGEGRDAAIEDQDPTKAVNGTLCVSCNIPRHAKGISIVLQMVSARCCNKRSSEQRMPGDFLIPAEVLNYVKLHQLQFATSERKDWLNPAARFRVKYPQWEWKAARENLSVRALSPRAFARYLHSSEPLSHVLWSFSRGVSTSNAYTSRVLDSLCYDFGSEDDGSVAVETTWDQWKWRDVVKRLTLQTDPDSEGQILKRLLQKIRRIRRELGQDEVTGEMQVPRDGAARDEEPRGLVEDADVPPQQQETLDAEQQEPPSTSASARQEGEPIELLVITVYSAGGTKLFHDGAVDPALEIGAFRELVAAAMQQTILSGDLQAPFIPAQGMSLALQRPKTVPVLLVPPELRETSLAALFGSVGSDRLELTAIMDTESWCRAVACLIL